MALAVAAAVYVHWGWQRRELAKAWNDPDVQLRKGDWAIEALDGLDGTGMPVKVVVTGEDPHLAIVVVGAPGSTNSCNYWEEVASSLRSDAGLQLVGFCARPGCCGGPDGSVRFPLISFGEQILMNQIGRLDRGELVLLIDGHGHAVGHFSWTGLAAHQTAARIKEMSHGG